MRLPLVRWFRGGFIPRYPYEDFCVNFLGSSAGGRPSAFPSAATAFPESPRGPSLLAGPSSPPCAGQVLLGVGFSLAPFLVVDFILVDVAACGLSSRALACRWRALFIDFGLVPLALLPRLGRLGVDRRGRQ